MFSTKDQIITLYGYTQDNKEFCGEFEYLWAMGTGIAANSTRVKPIRMRAGFSILFDEDSQTWFYDEVVGGDPETSPSDTSQMKSQAQSKPNEQGSIEARFLELEARLKALEGC